MTDATKALRHAATMYEGDYLPTGAGEASVSYLLLGAADTIERLCAALEQIRTVCIDNGGPNVKHDMALKFVCQVAANALLETGPDTNGRTDND